MIVYSHKRFDIAWEFFMTQPASSIHDIAKALGVNPSTVSRALNDHPAISTETRDRILAVCREMHFRPKSTLPCVGVVMPARHLSMQTDYCTVMLSLLAAAFTRQSMPIELLDLADIDKAKRLHISAVVGVVFDDTLRQLTHIPNLPIFSINHPLRQYGIHSAITDHAHGACIATEHLLARGHRKIAFLEHNAIGWGSKERQKGFRKTMKHAGIALPESAFFFRDQHGALHDILRRIRDDGFTALLNFDEPAAIETPHIFTRVLGVRIPEDISLISIEANSAAQPFLAPPQTVIRQPLDTLVAAVATAMCTMLDKGLPATPLNLCFENTLVIRESVGDVERI